MYFDPLSLVPPRSNLDSIPTSHPPLAFSCSFFYNSSPVCAVHILTSVGTSTGTWLTCRGPHPWTKLILLFPEAINCQELFSIPREAVDRLDLGQAAPITPRSHWFTPTLPDLWLRQSFCTVSCGDPWVLACWGMIAMSRLWLSALWTFLLCSLTSWELLS